MAYPSSLFFPSSPPSHLPQPSFCNTPLSPMAFSASFSGHSLPLLNAQPRRTSTLSKTHLLATSSQSQIFGLSFSGGGAALSRSSPATSTRPIVSAKVSKGDVPPPFALKNQDGKNVSLTSYKGKPLIVYFYPADETPGCTKQACAFRDSYEKFKKAGAEVIGISGDDPSSHKAFAKKYRLPFTLLSDEGNRVRKEWGVPSDLFGTLPGRQTYVIDRKGVVQLVYNNQFQPEKHVDETLKLLQSL